MTAPESSPKPAAAAIALADRILGCGRISDNYPSAPKRTNVIIAEIISAVMDSTPSGPVPDMEGFRQWAREMDFPVGTWTVSDVCTFFGFFKHGWRCAQIESAAIQRGDGQTERSDVAALEDYFNSTDYTAKLNTAQLEANAWHAALAWERSRKSTPPAAKPNETSGATPRTKEVTAAFGVLKTANSFKHTALHISHANTLADEVVRLESERAAWKGRFESCQQLYQNCHIKLVNAERELKRREDRLQTSPQGDDKIDELDSALTQLRQKYASLENDYKDQQKRLTKVTAELAQEIASKTLRAELAAVRKSAGAEGCQCDNGVIRAIGRDNEEITTDCACQLKAENIEHAKNARQFLKELHDCQEQLAAAKSTPGVERPKPRELSQFRMETIRHAANVIVNQLNEAACFSGTKQGFEALYTAQVIADLICQTEGATAKLRAVKHEVPREADQEQIGGAT